LIKLVDHAADGGAVMADQRGDACLIGALIGAHRRLRRDLNLGQLAARLVHPALEHLGGPLMTAPDQAARHAF
jgi:hypothetical protein